MRNDLLCTEWNIYDKHVKFISNLIYMPPVKKYGFINLQLITILGWSACINLIIS